MDQWIKTLDDDLFQDLKLPEKNKRITTTFCYELSYSMALKGVGFVHKNPLVGAVLVDKDHRYLACGSHRLYGGHHAEAEILAEIKEKNLFERLKGGRLYSTLEPCSFAGKTPSCAKSWANLPLSNLIYAQLDSHEKVNGQGLRFLERAGITCESETKYSQLCQSLTEVFFWNQASKLPFVALKAAISLDGMIGLKNQGQVSITGDRARRYSHWLRQKYEGIVVGADTLIVDNPYLNIRHPGIKTKSHPLKIILDPKARALCARDLYEYKILKNNPEKVLWVLSKDKVNNSKNIQMKLEQLEYLGAQFVLVSENEHGDIDTKELLIFLKESLNIQSVMLEGGRKVWASFLNKGFVNKIHLMQSSKIIGAEQGVFWAQYISSKKLKTLSSISRASLDSDSLLEGLINE